MKTLTNSEVEKEDQVAPVSNGISRENTEQGEMERPSRERARRLQVRGMDRHVGAGCCSMVWLLI